MYIYICMVHNQSTNTQNMVVSNLNPAAECFSPQPRLFSPQLYLFSHQFVLPQYSTDWPCYVFNAEMGPKGARKATSWVPKKRPSFYRTIVDHPYYSPPVDVLPRGTTTLMIKNVPNMFKRRDLLEILDGHCREVNQGLFRVRGLRFPRSKYDFAYLPMDFCKRANLGYAFVNFTNGEAAKRFYSAFQHYAWDVPHNKKICEVTVARIQGFEALRSHFRNQTYRYTSSSYLPVILSPPSDGDVPSKVITVGRIRLYDI